MKVNDYWGNEVNCESFIFQPAYGSCSTNMVFGALHDLPDDYDFTDLDQLDDANFVLLLQSRSHDFALEYCEALAERLNAGVNGGVACQ